MPGGGKAGIPEEEVKEEVRGSVTSAVDSAVSLDILSAAVDELAVQLAIYNHPQQQGVEVDSVHPALDASAVLYPFLAPNLAFFSAKKSFPIASEQKVDEQEVAGWYTVKIEQPKTSFLYFHLREGGKIKLKHNEEVLVLAYKNKKGGKWVWATARGQLGYIAINYLQKIDNQLLSDNDQSDQLERKSSWFIRYSEELFKREIILGHELSLEYQIQYDGENIILRLRLKAAWLEYLRDQGFFTKNPSFRFDFIIIYNIESGNVIPLEGELSHELKFEITLGKLLLGKDNTLPRGWKKIPTPEIIDWEDSKVALSIITGLRFPSKGNNGLPFTFRSTARGSVEIKLSNSSKFTFAINLISCEIMSGVLSFGENFQIPRIKPTSIEELMKIMYNRFIPTLTHVKFDLTCVTSELIERLNSNLEEIIKNILKRIKKTPKEIEIIPDYLERILNPNPLNGFR